MPAHILTTTATLITPTQFQISCDCTRGFHRFGNCKDQHTTRVETRGMTGHGCDKYTDCEVEINASTKKVEKF